MLSDAALTEAARYCDNDLALVLGERLETLTNAQEELEALQILYDRLVAENNALRDDMAEVQAHIDATRGYGPDE
jgi:succinylglutamate desuccinylase